MRAIACAMVVALFLWFAATGEDGTTVARFADRLIVWLMMGFFVATIICLILGIWDAVER